MNSKPVFVLFLLALVVLVGIPESFARPQYVTNLTAVYGGGSCGTCHVMPPGQRNFNGTFGQHNFNGTYVPRGNMTSGQRNFNRTRNSNRTFALNSYGTLFENQPNHATDPSAALTAIGAPPATPADTSAPATGAQAAPGFGLLAALAGLFAIAILVRRRSK